MKLYCLGTTGYHPSPTRHTACYYLPDVNLVMDAGTGVFQLIPLLREQPRTELDIFLSHAHLDHVIGLTFLLDVFAVTTVKKARIFGMPNKLDAVQQHLFNEELFPVLPPSLEFVPLEPNGPLRLPGGAQIDWFPLEHPGGSIGVRIEVGGKSIGYVTDTVARDDSSYLPHIRDLHLLLHECYFEDQYQELAVRTGHSWLSAVTQTVQVVRPRKTALIHLNPLAELIGSSMILSPEQERLGMFIPRDGQCIEI